MTIKIHKIVIITTALVLAGTAQATVYYSYNTPDPSFYNNTNYTTGYYQNMGAQAQNTATYNGYNGYYPNNPTPVAPQPVTYYYPNNNYYTIPTSTTYSTSGYYTNNSAYSNQNSYVNTYNSNYQNTYNSRVCRCTNGYCYGCGYNDYNYYNYNYCNYNCNYNYNMYCYRNGYPCNYNNYYNYYNYNCYNYDCNCYHILYPSSANTVKPY